MRPVKPLRRPALPAQVDPRAQQPVGTRPALPAQASPTAVAAVARRGPPAAAAPAPAALPGRRVGQTGEMPPQAMRRTPHPAAAQPGSVVDRIKAMQQKRRIPAAATGLGAALARRPR